MKKKRNLIIVSIFVIVLVLVILIFSRSTYTIEVELVDDFSPDRKLIVYKNDKKIEFKEIQYTDGTYLCSGKNPTVSYSEIMDEAKLVVKINDKKQVVAKIVEK